MEGSITHPWRLLNIVETSSLESLHFRNVNNIVWSGARELGHPCTCNILVLITRLEISQLRRWILKVARGNRVITIHTDNKNLNAALLICVSWVPFRTTVYLKNFNNFLKRPEAAALLALLLNILQVSCLILPATLSKTIWTKTLYEPNDIWMLILH